MLSDLSCSATPPALHFSLQASGGNGQIASSSSTMAVCMEYIGGMIHRTLQRLLYAHCC